MKRVIPLFLLLGFIAGCGGLEPDPVPPPDAPPTEGEIRALGPDAYNSFFLKRWRDCTRYSSETRCHEQIYGGGGKGLR